MRFTTRLIPSSNSLSEPSFWPQFHPATADAAGVRKVIHNNDNITTVRL
jgi:hypothetical protein